MSDHIEARCDDPSGFGDVIKMENAIPFNGESGPVFDIMCALTPIGDLLADLMKAMLIPVIGLPVMDGESTQWFVFSAASNQPWSALIGQGDGTLGVMPDQVGMYWEVVVPLSLMVLIIATAFISIRAGTMSRVAVQKQFRRIGVGFLTCFFWLPIASLALRFFHEITLFIAVPGDPSGQVVGLVSLVSSSIITLLTIGVGGYALAVFVGPVIAIILLVAVLAALTVVVMRWVLVVMITVSMPLVIAFWAVNAWPLNHFSRLASKVTSVYVGLLVSGLPSAMLIRILIELNNLNAGFIGDGSLNVGEFEAIFDFGEPIVALMVFFLPVFVFKSVVATTKMAAGMVAMETATAGQQTAQSAGRKAGRARGNSGGSGSSKSTHVAKTGVKPVETESVLAAVRSLSVPSLRDGVDIHDGRPSTATVQERLGVGSTDGLDPVDVYGLALGGIQGVASRVESVDDRLDGLEAETEATDARTERVSVGVTAAADQLDAVEAAQGELCERTDAAARRLDELKRRVDAVEDTRDDSGEDPR